MTDLRRDPLSGRLVAIAPGRAGRPGAAEPVADELEGCPFCAGREERTPPETLRLGEPWRVRVVPNLYPALDRQEVVVHTPEHRRSLAELDDAQLALVAEAWRERARAARAGGFGYLHALVNEGRDAGASLAHSHSQLVWLREPPPTVAAEHGSLTIANVVEERSGVVAFCPPAPRLPYETWIAPLEPEADGFESDRLPAALALLAGTIRRLEQVLGARPPLNAWLHTGRRWHLELLPRTSILAGLELGAGIYVNAVAPEAAAEALAAVSAPAVDLR